MGRLVDGVWNGETEQTRIGERGEFVRGVTSFRDRVSRKDGAEFPAEPGRYHLWVADNCPWAHRTVIVRNLKKLQGTIGLSVAHTLRNDDGWWYSEGLDAHQPVDGQLALHRLYSAAHGAYTGSATVPVLWDRKGETIVSNESAEIIEMMNSEFDAFGDASVDLYPESLRSDIDGLNARVYDAVNNGVYKCGFARTQKAYDDAVIPLFETLDDLNSRLADTRYLVGDWITTADVRLFTTLARFDAVYFGHFKCNLRRIVDYPNLWAYTRDLYQTPGIGETVHIDVYKKGYYGRSPGINPRGIIPYGPSLDFEEPHGRG